MSTSVERLRQAPTPSGQPEETDRLAERLYEQFGKPLESTHAGMFVAITPDGRTLLDADLVETVKRASAAFGPDNFVYRVGEGVVGTWR